MLLAHGRALYAGPGGFAPKSHFVSHGIEYQEGYNVADYLLEIASDPPVSLFQAAHATPSGSGRTSSPNLDKEQTAIEDKDRTTVEGALESGLVNNTLASQRPVRSRWTTSSYATTFLTQLEVLSGREWKILRRYVSRSCRRRSLPEMT